MIKTILLIALLLCAFQPMPPCSADNPRVCVSEVYHALVEQQGTPDNLDILAITFYGELGLFTQSPALNALEQEALVRSYYDTQSGACRPACDHVLDYLANSQHWRDSVHDGTVNLTRLLGRDDAYTQYRKPLEDAIAAHPEWLTGQGYGLPSMWGNVKLENGATAYTLPDGTLGALLIHYYTDAPATYGDVLTGTPRCTLAAVIIDVTGRMGVGGCNS